ncbi:unnamed protein product [Protopolystoma xenopodis]|uniref:Uncharacterized protein n=1 Tax=Protopolystoma xenopodis TaxID=117903 RepID=A0A3S5BC24_9PLAT|nr:unnamed protein product [Protopolystoma xenopodis]
MPEKRTNPDLELITSSDISPASSIDLAIRSTDLQLSKATVLQYRVRPFYESLRPAFSNEMEGTPVPFLVFLVDRFHSVTVQVYVLLHTLFLTALLTRTLTPHRAESFGAGVHTCCYGPFPCLNLCSLSKSSVSILCRLLYLKSIRL